MFLLLCFIAVLSTVVAGLPGRLPSKRAAPSFVAGDSLVESNLAKRLTGSTPASLPITLNMETTFRASNSSGDMETLIRLKVGTPPQTIDVRLDMRERELELEADDRSTCNQIAFPHHPNSLFVFHQNASSTFRFIRTPQCNSTNNEFPLNKAADGTDTVSFGQQTIPTFGLKVNFQDTTFIGGVLPGRLGMGPSTVFNGSMIQSVVNYLVEPEFGIGMGSWTGSATATGSLKSAGRLTLGGRDPMVRGWNFTFIPTTVDDSWVIPFHVPALNDSVVGVTSTAEFNLDVFDIRGPVDQVDAFYAGIPGAIQASAITPPINFTDALLVQENSTWLIPCNVNVTSQFKFGNATNPVVVPLAPNRLHLPKINGTAFIVGAETFCIGAVSARTPSSIDQGWVFGNAFFVAAYTIFRNGVNGTQPSIAFSIPGPS